LNNAIDFLIRLIFRSALLLLGLVFFSSLLIVTAAVLALWSARALWARLTGQPVAPPAFHFNARQRWSQFNARGDAWRAGSRSTQRDQGEVIDVEPREIKSEDPKLKE
jgi:hypothetical protein